LAISLYDRIGRWDGRRFYADVDVGGYDFAEFGEYIYAAAYDGVLYRFRDGIRWERVLGFYWGENMWSLAVYKGKLFMGDNNGGRETVLAIRVGCLSLERLIRFWAWLPTVFIWWRCCGVWGLFMGYR